MATTNGGVDGDIEVADTHMGHIVWLEANAAAGEKNTKREEIVEHTNHKKNEKSTDKQTDDGTNDGKMFRKGA